MLQVARLAPKQLGDSAELVSRFLHSQLNPDGGFRDRSGKSDLYYTVFGLEGLIALRAEAPAATAAYLETFGDGHDLDLVHLCCLIRCWANVGQALVSPLGVQALACAGLQSRLEAYRTPDGGYNTISGVPRGTAYGCFLAMGAYQDLRLEIPSPERLVECLRALRSADGGYETTPSTAAAASLFRHLDEPAQPELSDWLLARCKNGGFHASPAAPIPDLLSTATALHALSGTHTSIESIRESCLDFVDSLWTNAGAFYGNWADDAPDCEYTYYGLLALGHLSL